MSASITIILQTTNNKVTSYNNVMTVLMHMYSWMYNHNLKKSNKHVLTYEMFFLWLE